MFVTYRPDGEVEQEWEIDLDDLTASEGEKVERQWRKVTANPKATFDEWVESLYSGGMQARRLLLWHLMRREHPGLRYEDTPDFRRRQIVAEFSRGELKTFRKRTLEQPETAERNQAVEALDALIATARDSIVDPPESGKA